MEPTLGPPTCLAKALLDVPVTLLALGEAGRDTARGTCCPSPPNKAPSLSLRPDLFLPVAEQRGMRRPPSPQKAFESREKPPATLTPALGQVQSKELER